MSWHDDHWPKVGVGVFVIRGRQVLFGKRKGSHGSETWAPPGGKLDEGETVEACAVRETLEETGLNVNNPRKALVYTEDYFQEEGRQFITVYVLADYVSGEAEVKEPEKAERWEWFEWDNLPQPLFLTIQHLLEQGYRPPGV